MHQKLIWLVGVGLDSQVFLENVMCVLHGVHNARVINISAGH